jgi:lysophospholipase L1-like esterase
LVLVAACSSPSSPSASTEPSGSASASASASEATADFVLFALGDSIPFNAPEDCPGCTGFVDAYGAAVEAQTGQSVEVLNRSRHDGARTIDIIEQLESDEDFVAELATADAIIMSVGFNDQPPFADAHDGCPDPVGKTDPLETAVERAAATDRACVDSVVEVLRGQIAEVFAAVREQAPDAAIAALTAYDSWRGWSALDTYNQRTVDQLYETELYWFHQWRDALCAEADSVNAACVDVYSVYNGADGTQPPADFVAADYTHPSQEGNDVIRDLLIEALPIPQP